MPVQVKPLGPFEVGQQPTITAVIVDKSGGTGVVTGTRWTIIDPDHDEVEFTSPDPAITEVDDNIWTLLMPVIAMEGVYWIRCVSTGGLVAAHMQRLGVAESAFN